MHSLAAHAISGYVRGVGCVCVCVKWLFVVLQCEANGAIGSGLVPNNATCVKRDLSGTIPPRRRVANQSERPTPMVG